MLDYVGHITFGQQNWFAAQQGLCIIFQLQVSQNRGKVTTVFFILMDALL
jgi:hypothetical protein